MESLWCTEKNDICELIYHRDIPIALCAQPRKSIPGQVNFMVGYYPIENIQNRKGETRMELYQFLLVIGIIILGFAAIKLAFLRTGLRKSQNRLIRKWER
jgi:hypothetical protein